jgi:hypothetical protein
MKTILKSILPAAILFAATTGSAAGNNIPTRTNSILKQQVAEDPATPTAYDITMTALVQASLLLPLNATSTNGNIVMYTIITIPSVSQGELSIGMNGTLLPVSEGMMLTADLAANLYFIPDSAFSGNIIFTYSAADESGLTSNVANYTIPVTGKPQAILPVTILNFSGTEENKKVQLYWQTQNEISSSYFEIQRSIDGKTFETFATNTAKGNNINNYHGTDDLFFYNLTSVYYRIKMVDINGSFKYSASLMIRLGTAVKNNIKAWPLPFTGNLNVAFISEEDAPVKISIHNVAGSEVMHLSSNAKKGNNTISLYQAQTIPAGTYVLTISNSTWAKTIKVIKQ